MPAETKAANIVTGVVIVTLVMVLVRPTRSKFSPLTLLTGVGSMFQRMIIATYAAIGKPGHDAQLAYAPGSPMYPDAQPATPVPMPPGTTYGSLPDAQPATPVPMPGAYSQLPSSHTQTPYTLSPGATISA